MIRLYSLLIVMGWTLFPFFSLAQRYDPLHQPNTFRNGDNPLYWKNRKPFEGYWQQDVHYTIKATVDEQTDIISGTEKLQYWNNSPDELSFVYFHLYQNAFQPDSYYDDLQNNNNRKQIYGGYESEKKGTEILKLESDGKTLQTELDNTVLKVFLTQPLKSGESITFDIEFKTYFDSGGNVRRRMKTFPSAGSKHYDGVHWYPRISVYDRKFGWTTDQHLGREFYGDFGTFDVELTFASNYIVEATGFLTNREDMLPSDLREKLDLKHFSSKPWNSPPSIIIPYRQGQTKTWKFHAENVHDFAFTADPNYRIGEATWNGIKCIALVQEQHASGWQNAADYTAKIIQTYSEDFGMYQYHKMIVADAQDGMEYPMLTLDGGRDPGYRSLLAHEVGHNWFFGQVGNNETYRASLDEGFTQFLTVWCLEKIDGDTLVTIPSNSAYKRKFKDPDITRYRSIYYRYLDVAIEGEPATLNTHSDGFNGALRHGGGYGQVYFKTATMLYNLQYVLGDDLFLNAMRHYFDQWRFCHPYTEDFRNSIIQFTKVDLNWFFDQWLETKKRIDYSVESVKSKKDNQYEITFKRKGEMQMPLDIVIIDKNGTEHAYYIPNTWFEKGTTATVLPRWIGWDNLKKTHTVTITLAEGIDEVIIDPSGRLADVYQLDNRLTMPVDFSLDARVNNNPKIDKYELRARPEIWYNGFDGIKPGFHLNGDYMEYHHIFDFTFWVNTGALQEARFAHDSEVRDEYDLFSFRVNYHTATDRLMQGSSIDAMAKSLDGLYNAQLGFNIGNSEKTTSLYAYYKLLYREDNNSLNYLWHTDEWQADRFNNTLNAGLKHQYRYKRGAGSINFNLRSSSIESDYQYANLSLDVVNDNYLGPIKLRTRSFFQYGSGSNWAPESRLFLAGANPEELMENKYSRSRGFVNQQWLGHGSNVSHLQQGGGLNLRGYAGYLAPFEDEEGIIRSTYAGETGAAFSTELEFDGLVDFAPRLTKNTLKLNAYLFGDVGVINYSRDYEDLAFASIRADAGIGTALTIKKWGPIEDVKPLTIRFDMPLFLNRPPAGSEFLEFRWVVGINRAF